MLAVEKANTTSMMADGKVSKLPMVSQAEDLNSITPLSSMNVTPNEQDVISKILNIFICIPYSIYNTHVSMPVHGHFHKVMIIFFIIIVIDIGQ